MIERDTGDGITILRMRREPANALDLAFSDELREALERARDDAATGAIVLTGSEGVSSSGVDLFRLLDEGADYRDRFLDALDGLFSAARGIRKPLVAAVNGHAIAGGGVLALACDYRVMTAGGAMFGLPELRVGVPFPGSALAIIRTALPPHRVREIVLLGRNFAPEGALERGLVDEIAAGGDVLDRAVEVARTLAAIPPRTCAVTKRLLAMPPGVPDAALEAEVRSTWADPEIHDRIRSYLEETFGRSSK